MNKEITNQPFITLNQLRAIITVAEYGSINQASQALYVSQSTLSLTIKEAEKELGIEIFNRSNRGITLTAEGTEFLGYARQVIEQVNLLERRYGDHNNNTHKLSIATQHYAFSVRAFVDLLNEYDNDEYEFTLRETRTGEIIDDVKNFRSEIGIIYLSKFNEKVIRKTLSDAQLEFIPLFCANPHVFVGETHPLAQKESVSPQDLENWPRYSFEQGTDNSFFFSEEPLSYLPHKKIVTFSDRGTLTNLLTHHNGYTVSTGVLSDEMTNGIVPIPLDVDEEMTVGYIVHTEFDLSPLAKQYIEKLRERINSNPTINKAL